MEQQTDTTDGKVTGEEDPQNQENENSRPVTKEGDKKSPPGSVANGHVPNPETVSINSSLASSRTDIREMGSISQRNSASNTSRGAFTGRSTLKSTASSFG